MNKMLFLSRRYFCVIALVCILFLTACGAAKDYQTTNTDLYLQTEGHIANEGMDIRSGFFVFPSSISDLENVEYEYYCKEGIAENSYMINLKVEYPNQEAYEAEIERLENITCSVKTSKDVVMNNIEYTEGLFDYPAYVAIYNTNMSFEYALADEENNTIIYVYLRLCEGVDFLPKKYLPIEFRETSMMNYDTDWKNQNIYYAPDGDGVYVYYQDDVLN